MGTDFFFFFKAGAGGDREAATQLILFDLLHSSNKRLETGPGVTLQ